MTTREHAIVFGLSAVFYLILIAAAVMTVSAQKAERGTQQWTITVDKARNALGDVRVRVLDMSGVCLYIVRDPFTPGGMTIAAVSKATLPAGTGCQ